MNGGWGVGWTVELKLNRKKGEQIGFQRGGCDPLTPTPSGSATERVGPGNNYISNRYHSIHGGEGAMGFLSQQTIFFISETKQ